MLPIKQYIGDGAYAAFDGYGITLTAENGILATDTIYLEPSTWMNLKQFVEALQEAKQTGEAIAAVMDDGGSDEEEVRDHQPE